MEGRKKKSTTLFELHAVVKCTPISRDNPGCWQYMKLFTLTRHMKQARTKLLRCLEILHCDRKININDLRWKCTTMYDRVTNFIILYTGVMRYLSNSYTCMLSAQKEFGIDKWKVSPQKLCIFYQKDLQNKLKLDLFQKPCIRSTA